MNKIPVTGIGDNAMLEEIKKTHWDMSKIPEYNYDMVIPLDENKHISLKFTRCMNGDWMCFMSDECKRDLERIFPGSN
jgi:hypothetical protein